MRYRILVVEDDSKRIKDFIEFFGYHYLSITENAYEAKVQLSNEMFDYVFLDGDLGSTINGNGADVARFIRDNLNYTPEVIVHSWDISVGDIIAEVLPAAQHIAFGTEDFYSIQIGETI